MVGAGGPTNVADGQHLALRATSLVRDPMEKKRLHRQLAELLSSTHQMANGENRYSTRKRTLKLLDEIDLASWED
ncbi:hypothetical protein [Mesorhizobium delmotii]|uniref:hypothetical protein n=1 Tax=Mesorhizobium delmotii TaxID=1631247 RepID=UPI001057B8DE|nr:hypothetical protein [Mesorhizobium delmotii]